MIGWLRRMFAPRPVMVRPSVRAYHASAVDRLTSTFGVGGIRSADATIRHALPMLRARSRELAENNDYIAGYLELLRNQVVGPRGINLQVRARGGDGELDRAANQAVEEQWRLWGRRGSCEVSGRLSWVEVQQLALESMARDGEVFVRVIRAPRINRWHFTLQVIEADMVPVDMDDELSDGRRVRMGVELDAYDRPLAYYVLERHPGDVSYGSRRALRIPADEMVHLYHQRRPGQTRGVPWTASVMTRAHHIGAYEEAAIINARVGAAKMGFLVSTMPDAVSQPMDYEPRIEAGTLEQLPAGVDFKPFDPGYPTGEYDAFVRRQIKGMSCGLPGATYADLSNDLESVNFSSIRHGTLNARDSYRSIQQLLIDGLCWPVYERWLAQQLDFGTIVVANGRRGPNQRLSADKLEKFLAAQWVGRGWEWVDPLKDQQARTEALSSRLTTRSRIAMEMGEDYEEILAELAQEQQLAARYGVSLEEPPARAGGTGGVDDGDEE